MYDFRSIRAIFAEGPNGPKKNSKDLHRHLLPNTNYVENRFVIPICVTLIDFTVILCRFVDKRFIRMFAKSDRFFAFASAHLPIVIGEIVTLPLIRRGRL